MKTAWTEMVDGRLEDPEYGSRLWMECIGAADSVRNLLDLRGVPHPVCFISYAWEKDDRDTARLQNFLKFLKAALQHMGARVYLDIQDMHANMLDFMDRRIEESDYVFLIGTPRLKESLLDPDRNVSREYRQIQNRLPHRPELLVPVLVSGSYADAYPTELMKGQLVRDFRGIVDGKNISVDSLEQLLKGLLGIENPVGIVPMIYRNLAPTSEYIQIHRLLFVGIQNLRLQRDVTRMAASLCEIGNTAANEGDYTKACEAFESAAQARHVGSMIRLAQLLAYGHGSSGTLLEMLNTACSWSEKALRIAEDPEEKTLALRTDQQVQRKYQEFQAKNGDARAMCTVARMLLERQGVSQPKTLEERPWKSSLNQDALLWLTKAREKEPNNPALLTEIHTLTAQIERDTQRLR